MFSWQNKLAFKKTQMLILIIYRVAEVASMSFSNAISLQNRISLPLSQLPLAESAKG
jgi:hypothetical protein